MQTVFRENYGIKPRTDGKAGREKMTPTEFRFFEPDGSDVRVDRVRVYSQNGTLICSYLQDKMLRKFVDNLKGTEDDPSYLRTLPSKAKK